MNKYLYTLLLAFSSLFMAEAQQLFDLKRCIETGLEQNYSIRIIRNEQQISDNNATPGNAGYLPTVDMSGGFSGNINNNRNSLQDGSIEKANGINSETGNVGLNVNWTVFDGFGIQAEYSRLKELQRMGELNTRMTIEDFVANLSSDEETIETILAAIEKAGYLPGKDFMLAMDAAASEWKSPKGKGFYKLPKAGTEFTSAELIAHWKSLVEKYPIISIEDGLDEEDWEGWQQMTRELGGKVQLVGDDLFVTNTERLAKGIQLGAGNAILIKLNQIGSVSETLEAIDEDGVYTLVETKAPTGYEAVKPLKFTVSGSQVYIDGVLQSDRTIRVEDRIATTMVRVRKVWSDSNYGNRPEKVTFHLLRNAKELTDKRYTVEVDSSSSWTHTWTDLPRYDENGERYNYTVDEETTQKLKDGSYRVSITKRPYQDGAEYTVLNVREPDAISAKVTKNWNDNSDNDGKRPHKLTFHVWGTSEQPKDPTDLTQGYEDKTEQMIVQDVNVSGD